MEEDRLIVGSPQRRAAAKSDQRHDNGQDNSAKQPALDRAATARDRPWSASTEAARMCGAAIRRQAYSSIVLTQTHICLESHLRLCYHVHTPMKRRTLAILLLAVGAALVWIAVGAGAGRPSTRLPARCREWAGRDRAHCDRPRRADRWRRQTERPAGSVGRPSALLAAHPACGRRHAPGRYGHHAIAGRQQALRDWRGARPGSRRPPDSGLPVVALVVARTRPCL